MKISNASKKVLASALSAAMVVAFAPTVAFGATVGQKVTIEYDFGTGSEFVAAGTQGLDKSQTVKVESAADGNSLQNATGKLGIGKDKNGDPIYAFANWQCSYDINGDGDVDDPNEKADYTDATVFTTWLKTYVPDGKTVKATAKYSAPSVAAGASVIGQTAAATTLKFTAAMSSAASGAKYEATLLKDGAETGYTAEVASDATAVEINLAKSANNKVDIDLAAGTYTLVLTDATNKIEVSKADVKVAALELTDGTFDRASDSTKTTSKQTLFFEAGDKNYASVLEAMKTANFDTVPNEVDGTPAKKELKGYKNAEGAYVVTAAKSGTPDAWGYTAADNFGTTTDKDKANLLNKAQTYRLTAAYKGEASIASFKHDATAGKLVASVEDLDGAYSVVITNAKGEVVLSYGNKLGATYTTTAPTADAKGARTSEISNPAVGTYTLTVTTETAGSFSDAGKVVKTATAEVKAASYAAAPTWSYAVVDKKGQLTLSAAAGFDVYYQALGTNAATPVAPSYNAKGELQKGSWNKYDAAKGALSVATGSDYAIVAVTTDAKADPAVSAVTRLAESSAAKSAVQTFANAQLNEKAAASNTWYSDVKAVKDAAKAAVDGIEAAGFEAFDTTVSTESATSAWKAAVVKAEKSVLEAIAAYNKGLVEADSTSAAGDLTKVSDADRATYAAAADKVLAAFDANHDNDATNNVSGYSDADGSYAKKLTEAASAALKAAKTYKKADVDAAAAATKALKEAKTADELNAALKAYGELTTAQKELVASADVQAAQEALVKAELAEAQDEAAIAKVKGKTVKAKAKKATKSSLKVVTSKSGAKSTFKKASGNSKVKVYKSGKIVVKKGLKAGKKYTVKVKATVGASTKTVKVIVKVAK